MLGHVLIVINIFIVLAFVYIQGQKVSAVGDQMVGYSFSLFIIACLMGVGFLALAVYFSLKDSLIWISPQKNLRIILTTGGFVAAAVSGFAMAIFRWEWQPGEFSPILKLVADTKAGIWIPVSLLAVSLLLQYGETPGSFLSKLVLTVIFSVSAIICLVLLFNWIQLRSQQQQMATQQMLQRTEQEDREHLEFISMQSDSDPIINLLALTGRYHNQAVREAAIAKVKSHPDWEDQLISILQNPRIFPEAYHFIDGVKLENPEKFKEPIQQSLNSMAMEIKSQIATGDNLQSWQFEHLAPERILRGIEEQYPDHIKDFVPQVQMVSSALKTPLPDEFKDVRFDATRTVDKWLKRHAK